MPRKRPSQYEAAPVSFDESPFDAAVLRSLFSQARIRLIASEVTLAKSAGRLNVAALRRQVDQDQRLAPTEHMIKQTLEAIHRHAALLRQALPLTDSDGLGGAGDNPRVVRGVARLLTPTMMRLMDKQVDKKRDEKKRGAGADELFGAEDADDVLVVLQATLGVVAEAAKEGLEALILEGDEASGSPNMQFAYLAAREYQVLTGRSPISRSWDESQEKLGGPLIRFLVVCLGQLGEEVRPTTVDEWIEVWRKAAQSGSPAD